MPLPIPFLVAGAGMAAVHLMVPAVAATLSMPELNSAVNGKTFTSSRMGMTMRITLQTDGTVQARLGPMRSSGSWSIEADKLCLDLPRRPANQARCQSVELLNHKELRLEGGMVLKAQ